LAHRISRFAAAFATLLGTSLIPASAEPAHNYVFPDMTWHKLEPPPPGRSPPDVVLVDTESAKKFGDTVQFDELLLKNGISYTPAAHKPPAAPNTELALTRYEVSCGWGTMRRLPARADEAAKLPVVFWSPGPNQTAFLLANRPDSSVIDKLCAGVPLNAAQGARSIAQAISFLKDSLYSAVNTITTQLLASGPRFPPPPMDPTHVHRFVEIQTDDASGNALFLDRAKLTRDGNSVTALSLVVLGPTVAQSRINYGAILALRKTRYDCAGQSLTVLAQGLWNRYGELMWGGSGVFGQRFAAESPITAADIKAACSEEASGSQSFATIEDAWADAQNHWPRFELPAWLSCAWNELPDPARAQYLSDWKSYAAQTVPGASAPQAPNPVSASACGIPDSPPPRFAMAAYAMQRGALVMLSAQQIDEAKIRAAWNGIPWVERQQFARSIQYQGQDSLQLRSDVVDRAANRLGIATTDTAARAQLEDYLVGEVRIE
jgi:hypothetical protein